MIRFSHRNLVVFVALCTLWLLPTTVLRGDAGQVVYTCNALKPETHFFHITLVTETNHLPSLDFQMPAWNGLYQIRDFAVRVRQVRAYDEQGKPLPVDKIDKQTWRVSTAGVTQTRLEYEIFANEAGPFAGQINQHHAFINPAYIFMYPVGQKHLPIKVKFILPEEWRIASALASSLDRMVFVAQNYDQFADSPFELGTFRWLGFEARGAKFDVIVDTKLPSIADTDLLSMLKQIVETEMDLMQDQPFSRYTFFYHFPSGHSGGGMEHGCSAAINLGSEELSQGLDLLAALTAHEFFHVWNVKRIRPAALEPIDYTKENFTRALWFSEGVTSLYGSYSLVRSQIETKAAFYQALATVIQDIQSRPARLRQSVEEASLDTWLEKYAYYRRPENSISYYETGEMLGFLLDLTIRQSTRNQRSLDDVLRYLNEEYAMKHRFFDDKKGIPDAVAVIAGHRLDDFFDRYVHGVDEIDYNAFLVMAGLELNHESLPSSDIGFTASRNDDGRWLAEEVTEGGAVATAGLVAGDEILELNGEPASFQLLRRLNTASVPKPFKIKFRHEDRVEEKSLSPGTRASIHYSIVEIPNPSNIQLAIRKGILTGK